VKRLIEIECVDEMDDYSLMWVLWQDEEEGTEGFGYIEIDAQGNFSDIKEFE